MAPHNSRGISAFPSEILLILKVLSLVHSNPAVLSIFAAAPVSESTGQRTSSALLHSILAAIIGKAAFFAPLITTSPLTGILSPFITKYPICSPPLHNFNVWRGRILVTKY